MIVLEDGSVYRAGHACRPESFLPFEGSERDERSSGNLLATVKRESFCNFFTGIF
jgi:hypothetical protein